MHNSGAVTAAETGAPPAGLQWPSEAGPGLGHLRRAPLNTDTYDLFIKERAARGGTLALRAVQLVLLPWTGLDT